MRRRFRANSRAVFLNVPYDADYEPLFVALVAAVLALGRGPRCVLEIPDKGEGRLSRLLKVIGECRTSFHDLSREGRPARHNMPFEFGMAYARRKYLGNHDLFILERVKHRTQKTLSDGCMFECHPYGNNPHRLMACVFDALGSTRMPSQAKVRALLVNLRTIARRVKRQDGRDTLFERTPYLEFRNAAVLAAGRMGFYATPPPGL